MKKVAKLASVVATLILAACWGGGGGGGLSTLSGTAAQGVAIANATVTVKDINGAIKTSTTGAEGKYSLDVADVSPPFLLKVPSGSGFLYGVATATGTANIHPFTDLIIRNWYEVKGADIEAEFGGPGALVNIPAAAEINGIEAATRNILSVYLEKVGITPSGFNLITSPFEANHAGFDMLLDDTRVAISTYGIADVHINFSSTLVSVTATDPTTGISGKMAFFSMASNLVAADTELPSAPTNLVALPADSTKIMLVWSASTDNIGVAGYNIYRDSAKISTTPFPVFSDTGLPANSQYCYRIEAIDAAGNLSRVMSAETCATTLSATDNIAPSAPSLTVNPTSSSRIHLSWAGATDNVGVIGYKIYRSKVKITGTGASNHTDTGLQPETQYCYTVKAIDAALNNSVESNQACATTQATILPRSLAGSCTVPNVPGTYCTAYIGAYYSSAQIYAAQMQSPCGSANPGTNVWSTGYAGYCPTANAVGHCYNSVETFKQTDTYYYLPLPTDATASSLQATCEMTGAWFYLPD